MVLIIKKYFLCLESIDKNSSFKHEIIIHSNDGSDGTNEFLKNNKCSVYKSRPSQCRTWPFWNENMNPKIWNEDISINCPGIGKGNKIKSDSIKKFLKEDSKNERLILKNRIIPQK